MVPMHLSTCACEPLNQQTGAFANRDLTLYFSISVPESANLQINELTNRHINELANLHINELAIARP